MANPNFANDRRQRNKLLRDNVNALYERVHRMFDGVYFEILIENRTPELEPAKQFLFHIADIEDDLQNERIMALHANPVIKQRLCRIAKLQENYKILMDTTLETFTKLKEEYVDAIYNVRLISRKQSKEFEMLVPYAEEAIDAESEEEYCDDDDEDMDSDMDWDSESDESWISDSGLDSETDTQSEFDQDLGEESEPDSGID